MLKINPRVAGVCCLGRVLSRCLVISPPKVLVRTLSQPEAFIQQEFLLSGQGATRDSASDRVAVGPGVAFAGFSPRVRCPYVLKYLQQKNQQAGQSLGPSRCQPRQVSLFEGESSWRHI